MSQQAALCRNKVQAKINTEVEYCGDKEFFCHDVSKEYCEEDYRDIQNLVAT